MPSPMMRVLSSFHVIIWDMITPLSSQNRWNISIIQMVSSFHPYPAICSPAYSAWLSVHWWHQNHRRIEFVAPYSKLFHYSIMQNNLIRSVFDYFAIAVCNTQRTRELPRRLLMNVIGSLVQSISYGCIESASGWTPILKQSMMWGRSVVFSLCNIETGMTNTINLSPFTSGIFSCWTDIFFVRFTCCVSQRFKSQ